MIRSAILRVTLAAVSLMGGIEAHALEPGLQESSLELWAEAASAPAPMPVSGSSTSPLEDNPSRGVDVRVPLAGPVDPDVYRLGPGDVLLLQLSGQVSKTMMLEVDAEGGILVPSVGNVRVVSHTLNEARREILARVQGQFRNVHVDLRLGRLRSFVVYLTGRVRAPGPKVVHGAMRAVDLLDGSQLLEDASRRRIEVTHSDGQREYCDLELFLRVGDASHNPVLRDGDVLHVPTATEFVYAGGAVAQPGRFELGPRDSLRTLLRLAGHPVPSAVVDSVLIVRFRTPMVPESLWVTLSEIYAGRVNPPIRDGTRLYVYFSPRYNEQREAAIYGEIVRPGPYPIEEGHTRLSSLIQAAGGFMQTSDPTAIHVHRTSNMSGEKDLELERMLRLSRDQLTPSEYEVLRTKLAGQKEDYRVDWARLQRNPDLDLLLRDGDVVRVERELLSVRVDGEVQRPGFVNLIRGGDVDTYVSAAGGYTTRAWRGKIRVTRAVTGQTLLAQNVTELDAGDLIWVPEKQEISIWTYMNRMLATLVSVATIVIAIRSLQ